MQDRQEPLLQLPCAPEQLTAHWLTDALRSALADDSADIVDFAWKIIGQEWGFTGVIARIWPNYSSAASALPVTLVAKFPMATRSVPSHYQSTTNRNEQVRRRRYERSAREILVYQQIASKGEVPAPRLYFGVADAESQCIVLLLEDLDGTAGDALQDCSPDQVEMVLAALAPFHARWWQSPQLQTLSWLPRWGDDITERANRYRQSFGPFLSRFGAQLPAEAEHLIESLANCYVPLFTELAGAPATVIHGDLHLDNVIFSTRVTGPKVWIIDWQGAMRGPAVLDLTFPTCALSVSEQRTSKGRLLEQYHSRLVGDGVTDYPLTLIERHYRLALLASLAAIVPWLATVDLGTLTGRERETVEAAVTDPRLFAALLDHHTEQLLVVH